MSQTGEMSARARTRLNSFTGAVTVFGLIAVLGIGIAVFGNLGGTAAGGDRITTSEDYYTPWDDPNPTAATADGDTWSGRGQQYIPLTGLTPGEPLVLTLLDGSELDDYYLTTGSLGGVGTAVSFHSYSDVGDYLMPSASEMTLWVKTRSTDPWSVRIKPADLEELSGTVSATRPKTFLYTGTATAARFTVSGHAQLEVITEEGIEDMYPWFESESQSVAWPASTGAVFVVDSSPDAAWTLEFYEPAPTPAPTSTTPAPTPSSTPTSDDVATDE